MENQAGSPADDPVLKVNPVAPASNSNPANSPATDNPVRAVSRDNRAKTVSRGNKDNKGREAKVVKPAKVDKAKPVPTALPQVAGAIAIAPAMAPWASAPFAAARPWHLNKGPTPPIRSARLSRG